MNWEKFCEKIEDNKIDLSKLQHYWMANGKVVTTRKRKMGIVVIIIPFLFKENAEKLFEQIKKEE